MDALQWMGAVRMRVQTVDKNITIIHTTPAITHGFWLWTPILSRSNGLKFVLVFFTKTLLFSSQADGLEWCVLLWCFYQLFGLSFWRHPSNAEHPFLSKWWNATFLQMMKKQTHLPRLGWHDGQCRGKLLLKVMRYNIGLLSKKSNWLCYLVTFYGK